MSEQQTVLNAHVAAHQFMEQLTEQEAKTVKKMAKQAALNDYHAMRQAKIAQAANEALEEAEQEALASTQQFFGLMRTTLAQKGLDTQHEHQIPNLPKPVSLESLESFDTDLDAEMGRLADQSGSILIQAEQNSSVGF